MISLYLSRPLSPEKSKCVWLDGGREFIGFP
jgi:hypothetical protein